MGRTRSTAEMEALAQCILNALHVHMDSFRQGLYNLFRGHSGGGHEICELPACKWISNCCKYSFRRKLLSTREEKRHVLKKKSRGHTWCI